MLDLDDEESWTALTHAYRSAKGTPALLRRFDEELRRGALSDETCEQLRSSLLHQGDVYPATVAAVPHLVSAADASKSLIHRLWVWSAAGDAARGLAKVDREGYGTVTTDLWTAFDAALARARALAVSDALAPTKLTDEQRFRQIVSVTDLHGWHDLALAIEGLGDGELVVICEECGVDAQVDPGELRGPSAAERTTKIARGVERVRGVGDHVGDPVPAELIAGLASLLAPASLIFKNDVAKLAERIFDLSSSVPCPECDAPITPVSPARFGARS